MRSHLKQLLRPITTRFPRAGMTLRALREQWRSIEQPAATPMGFMLVGNQAMQEGRFEVRETALVRRLLPQVDVLVNVGANIGYYCCIALSLDKEVVAFEPMPHNLRSLLRNAQANGWEKRIEILPLALSDAVGIIEIYGDGTGASLVKGWAGTPASHVTLVPTTTLDRILGARLHGRRCLVLVDIEGAEKRFLDGAAAMLTAEPRPLWLVEIAITEHQPSGVLVNPHLLATFETFWQRGYEAWTADDLCRPVFREEVQAIAEGGPDTLKVHNFLFVAGGMKSDLGLLG